MRAADPAALGAWYRDCLGLDADENGLWRQGAGPTVFATFESETDYFGSRAQQAMLNFRVCDLDAMLAQLRAKGADVAEETQDMEGVGRFGWVTDPEGNRVELWQPACPSVRRSRLLRSGCRPMAHVIRSGSARQGLMSPFGCACLERSSVRNALSGFHPGAGGE